jgi:hypothetical protein
MVITIRNNAPGGGGNDWAIDDISVASCSPNTTLVPNNVEIVCGGFEDTVGFTISSTFHVYNSWQLQKSTDGGVTWTSPGNDTAGNADNGTATPVYDSTSGQYTYTISRNYGTNLTDTAIQYRIIVASSAANLAASSCSFIGSAVKIVRTANCILELPTEIISFNGKPDNDLAHLQWVTSNETGYETYTVQRSGDGLKFMPVGTLKATAGGNGQGTYQFTDPQPLTGQTYYRIDITRDNYSKYSSDILLGCPDIVFDIKRLANPFSDHISFDLAVPGYGRAAIRLLDMYGRRVGQENLSVSRGLNNVTLAGLGSLAAGVYALQVQYDNKEITRLVVKPGLK